MAEGVGFAPENEPGSEMQFCPIRQLPIVRSQRVRTLPGFHLLSLAAGREALANGYYTAFGQKFTCTDLEYLHVDDKVFMCAEDHKVFLNQMSMQYHRYIRYELEERKSERKRLRERAAERQARSLAHAAREQQKKEQVHQQTQLRQKEPQAAPADPRASAPAATPGAVSTPAVSAVGTEAANQQLAVNDPYLATPAGAPVAVDDPYAVPEDPYQEGAAEASAAAPKAAPAAGKPPAGPGQTSVGSHREAAEAPVVPAAAATAAVPQQAPAAASPVAPRPAVPVAAQNASAPAKSQEKDATADDLYGDVADREVKKPRTTSTYASAIGAMMTDDFDEDE